MKSIRKFLKFRREAGHGGIVPGGWQMAWYEPRRRVAVYYPAILSWVLRVVRELKYRARVVWDAPRLEAAEFFAMQRADAQRQRLADEYSRGYMAGWHECFQTCVNAIEDEMAQSDRIWEIGALLADEGKPPRPKN